VPWWLLYRFHQHNSPCLPYLTWLYLNPIPAPFRAAVIIQKGDLTLGMQCQNNLVNNIEVAWLDLVRWWSLYPVILCYFSSSHCLLSGHLWVTSAISSQPASILPHLNVTSVCTAIKEMRDKKATGVDDVPGDVLTLLGEGGLWTVIVTDQQYTCIWN
jgi:hypothetical protein